MGLTLSISGNAPSSALRYYLSQPLLFCHTRLPLEVTILLLVGHQRLLVPPAAMHGPLVDSGVWGTCG